MATSRDSGERVSGPMHVWRGALLREVEDWRPPGCAHRGALTRTADLWRASFIGCLKFWSNDLCGAFLSAVRPAHSPYTAPLTFMRTPRIAQNAYAVVGWGSGDVTHTSMSSLVVSCDSHPHGTPPFTNALTWPFATPSPHARPLWSTFMGDEPGLDGVIGSASAFSAPPMAFFSFSRRMAEACVS